jgi:hypothetical protein
MNMDKIFTAIGVSVVAVGIIVALGLLVSLPVMWLWNGCLVGAVDGIHELTWFQSWGIVVLFNMLFKSHTVQPK